MIATDGTRTIANANAVEQRANRKRSAILRAWYSTRTAYPGASVDFRLSQAAQVVRCPVSLVERVVASVSRFYVQEQRAKESPEQRLLTVDWQDYDQNSWNLH